MTNHLSNIVDSLLVFIIIGFLILFVWSKIMNQRVIDSLYEIKEFVASFGGIAGTPEEVIAR